MNETEEFLAKKKATVRGWEEAFGHTATSAAAMITDLNSRAEGYQRTYGSTPFDYLPKMGPGTAPSLPSYMLSSARALADQVEAERQASIVARSSRALETQTEVRRHNDLMAKLESGFEMIVESVIAQSRYLASRDEKLDRESVGKSGVETRRYRVLLGVTVLGLIVSAIALWPESKPQVDIRPLLPLLQKMEARIEHLEEREKARASRKMRPQPARLR